MSARMFVVGSRLFSQRNNVRQVISVYVFRTHKDRPRRVYRRSCFPKVRATKDPSPAWLKLLLIDPTYVGYDWLDSSPAAIVHFGFLV